MFPVIHGILAQSQEGTSVCKYPLDKTDFSDVEIYGDLSPAIPLDGSFQRFEFPEPPTGIDFAMVLIAAEGTVFDGYYPAPPVRGKIPANPTFATKFKLTSVSVPVVALLVDLSEDVGVWLPQHLWVTYEAAPVRYIVDAEDGSHHIVPDEVTLIFSVDTSFSGIKIDCYIVETGQNLVSVLEVDEDLGAIVGRNFGFFSQGIVTNTSQSMEGTELELITDYETLLPLVQAANFGRKVNTICGQTIEPAGG